MRERIKSALRKITADDGVEARWLNTVSYMEYVGARKIFRSVAQSHPSASVLDHLADETRHAAAFKELARHRGGGEPTQYLCLDEARTYFHKLDRELSAWTTDLVGEERPHLNYLLVTSMIERRAMELYPLYRSASQDDVVRGELAAIITEEQDHRVRIEETCVRLLGEYGIGDLTTPQTVEAAFFAEFWSAIEAALGTESLASAGA